MAWDEIEVQVNDKAYQGHKSGEVFSVPYASGIEIGSPFSVAGAHYEALSVADWGGRNEILLVTAKEVKNDKPKARRASTQPVEPDVRLPDHDGHNDPD
jgi:hypothetical protein